MTNTIAKRTNAAQPATFGSVVDNIFQNSLHRFFDDNFWGLNRPMPANSVPVNIRETDNQYEIEVIAPGCKKEDFKISMNANVLSVTFQHNEEKRQEDKEAGWIKNEYSKRSFSRSFTLDDSIDVNNIQANYVDGILLLKLPKNEKAKQVSRNIEVK